MVITTTGTSGTAILLRGGSVVPSYIAIGSGSGTALDSVTGLFAQFESGTFSSIGSGILNVTSWITDFSALVMSGNELREFGLFDENNDCWHYENLGDPVIFDGSNELKIEITWEVV